MSATHRYRKKGLAGTIEAQIMTNERHQQNEVDRRFYIAMEEQERIIRMGAARRLMNITNTINEINNSTAFEESSALRQTLKVYGSTFLGLFVLFCILQMAFPRLYAIRSWSESLHCNLALIQYGIFDWIWKVYWVHDDDIQDQCGMDTLCFFRMLRLGRKLALVGCFNAIWLIPLYRLDEDSSPGTQSIASNGLASISIINVPTGSKRLVGTVVAAYILFFYTMWMVLKEFEWYISYRHRFLEKRLARNYTVYVSGIPEEYRSSHKLADYFRRCCAFETDVLEAHCALNIPNLESKVAKRNALLQRLEHAQALEEMQESPPTISCSFWRRGPEAIESVRKLQEEISAIERDITTTSSRHLREHDRYLSKLQRSTARTDLANGMSDDEEDVHETATADAVKSQKCICCGRFDEASIDVDGNHVSFSGQPHDKQSSHQLDEHPLDQSQHSGSSMSSIPEKPCPSRGELSRPMLKAFSSVLTEVKPDKLKHHFQHAGKSGVKNVKRAGAQSVRHVKRVGELGVENVLNIAELGTNVVGTAVGTAVTIVVGHEEGTPREAGFVVFTKLYAVHSALQMVHHPTPYVMEVFEAPEPDEIFWRNVGLSVEGRRVGGYLSLAASTVLCFFWSIPVAFISSLTQVSSLEKSIPFLKKWVEKWPKLAPFFAQLAPLLLYLLNNQILPSLLTEFSKWEGLIGSSSLEASVFVKMSAFTIIQTFFVSAISGSIAAELSNILNDPEKIVDLLADSLPGQSAYFLQIILVFTFTVMTFTMLRINPLIQAGLRTKLGPRLTEKERNRPWVGLHPLGHPPEFQNGQNTAQFIITFMVTFVYAVIAPITAFFLLACFILLESVYRLEFFRNYPVASDSGGKLWIGFINILVGCMVFAQLTLVGFLALKKAVAALPLMLPLIVITILFYIFINDKHIKVATTLPTSACLELDKQNEQCGLTDFSFVHARYLQSALQPGNIMRDAED